ncbi:DMT family transporter [Rhizobium sp. SSA_523]|uniref:DMT family transporter n=1 Tax=Rhizobium sp. SSA_523 TaxID=2952477 RepID=UPI0020904C1D|nr:DMT family transporter [Rhizobium sp. SSA_523]MCO5730882.1 DMT family transporter [Rhizobium sp. SSA_523]WKC24302.1 DMT family transporter [Rhizobium sp. SSA_523]
MPFEAQNPLRGIAMKVISVIVFLAMQTCIKSAGEGIPAGQITFYRSAFALVPIFGYLAVRRELNTAFRTQSPFGHLKRGLLGVMAMACGFYGLIQLPLPDAIAIGYASPLMAVIFAALILKERVRIYRWTAVALGIFGVLIISWPKLSMFEQGGMAASQASGALAVLLSAVIGGLAMVQTRQLVTTEKTATIVVFFSLTASVLSLISYPFGWAELGLDDKLFLVGAGFCGGLGQIFLTESYRHADVSTVAPFDYSSIILGIVIAYFLFGDVPTWQMLLGTSITVSAGIFIIYREHQLGLERKAARKASSPPA